MTLGPEATAGTPAGSRATLVDRLAELSLLTSAYEDAKAARPNVILLSGPPGVGKTALLREFLRPIRAEAQLLYADGDENEGRLPFGLLQQLLTGVDTPLKERLTAVVSGEAPTPEPLAVGVDLLAVIAALEEQAPVVIVVDDAPLADRRSLEALTFSLRRLRTDTVLAVLALRSGDEPALPSGLLRMRDGESGRWIPLEGLTPTDLQALSVAAGTGELSTRSARRLHAYTDGNPLFALATLREVGPDALRGEDALPAPPSLSVLFLSRMVGCSDATVRLVRAAAVLGARTRLDLAARVADVGDPLAAVEEGTEAGLLRLAHGDDQRLGFAHPLIHAAVYSDLGPAQRAALHARAAEFLSGDAALDHRIRASSPDNLQLADELRARAAEEASRRLWPAAGRHLLAAARLHPKPEARSECLLRAAALMLAGSDYAGVAGLEEEIRALEPGPWRDYVLGHLTIGRGGLAKATRHLEEALHAADAEHEPDLVAAIAFILGECRLLSAGPGEETARMGRLALRLAPPGSPARLAWVAVLIGTAVAGRPREALRLAPAPEQMEPGPEMLGLLLGRGTVRMFVDDLDGARRDLSAIEGPLVHAGPGPLTGPVLFHRADVELRAGAWDDALAFAHLGLSIADDTDDPLAAGFHATIVGSVHALRGEWGPAERYVTLAQDRARTSEAGAHTVYAGIAGARLALARGDPDGMVSALSPLLGIADNDGLREHAIVPWRDLYAEALIRLGRLDEAAPVIEELEAHAAGRDLGSAAVAALQLRGILETARGRRPGARRAFDDGLERVRGLGMPFLEGRLALELGAFLRRHGSRRDAAAHLETAATIFHGLRARPFLERCERELRATGRRRAPRGVAHLTLTPQEFAVARLVTRGLSNREAAAELVVSVKTIEYHLSNLYAKLGLTSRTQLVARLARGDSAVMEAQPDHRPRGE